MQVWVQRVVIAIVASLTALGSAHLVPAASTPASQAANPETALTQLRASLAAVANAMASGDAATLDRAWAPVLRAADEAETALGASRALGATGFSGASRTRGTRETRETGVHPLILTDRAPLRDGYVRAAIADVRSASRAAPQDAARLLAHARDILARLH